MPCKKVKKRNRSKPQRLVSCTNARTEISTPAFYCVCRDKITTKNGQKCDYG